MNDTNRDRVSLHGLSPEEALRALLAVNPDDETSDETSDEDDGVIADHD